MPLPLLHLLEPPGFDEGDKGSFDNELKLWGMLKQLRTGLVGQGGPLSGWGFTSGDDGSGVGGIMGEVVYLGAFGQLTVDGTCLLFEDSAKKRVGVNTCTPQYPLDINSNECDAKIVAIRNGNADADVDIFANYDAAPGARVRLSRTDDGVSDPAFQLRFYTNEDLAGINTLQERLSLSKVVDIKSGFALSGDITINLTADQNNWDPTGLETASVIRISTTGNRNITGLARGTDGSVKIIRNVDASETITLVNSSASSSTFNRFSFGSNLVIPPGGTVMLLYDGTLSRWINAAGTASTGSGITNRIAYWVTPTVLGAVNAFTTDGQVMFAATTTRLPAGSNNLLWDQVNNRLRVGPSVLFAPLNALEIQGGSNTTFAIYNQDQGGTSGPNVEGYKWHSSGLHVNHPLISIRGGGNHVSSPTGRSIQGRMEVRAAQTWSASVRGTYITLETTPIGSLTMAERVRIVDDGSVYFWAIPGDTNFERLAVVHTSGTRTALTMQTGGTGADNLDLALIPAGTGLVQFGGHTALGAETVTGYVTIKDSGGTDRKLAVVS